jgi:aminoglycoside 6'-N-acetyltransferase I
MAMTFLTIAHATQPQIRQGASVLFKAMKDFTSAWPNFQSALSETENFLSSDRLAFLALGDGNVTGLIGAIRHTQLLWELHPLAVHPDHQRKGIGRALVQTLEIEARKEEVSTIYLGTDDELGGTNIFGKNLYPNVLDHALRLQPVSNHPWVFYKAMGYSVTGIIPDAGGPGIHDILMAKRIT